MINDQEVPKLPTGKSAESIDQFQRHWFCVVMDTTGKIIKQDAESPVDFLPMLNNSVVAWVDYITHDPVKDLSIVAEQLGFSSQLISSLTDESALTYQDFDIEMYMKLPSIQIRQADVQPYPLFLLLKRNYVFTIHTHFVDKRFIRLRRYSDTILRKIPIDAPSEDKLTMLLTRIIDANNDSNFRHLRVIEELGDALNQDLMNAETPRAKLGPEIYRMKHALISYMNALWDSVDVLHALRYGDAELITNDENLTNMLSLMADEVKGQIGLAEHMSEVLASGLEVLQSIYNNQLQLLNNRLAMVMTYLTIIGTAVLVPNTLATILSNPSFSMVPHDLWWYIPLLVGSTVLATWLAWWWVKVKGWLPRKVD